MISDTNPTINDADLAAFMREKHRLYRQDRNYGSLDAQIATYLHSDKQQLQAEIDQAEQAGKTEQIKKLYYRLSNYYLVEDFFFYLTEQGQPSQLTEITPSLIGTFLFRPRPIFQYKPTKHSHIPGKIHYHAQIREKRELKDFFNRAEQRGLILQNPVTPFIKMPTKLVPVNPSPHNQTDNQAFEKYLQRLVDHNRLSPKTAERHQHNFRILLHDIEQFHRDKKEWPSELDRLFADPKWIADWLTNLENRSTCTASSELARGSIHIYLRTVRHIWLFLRSQRRVDPKYYNDLKDLFRLDGNMVLLPGRSPNIIPALSETEQEAVAAAIERYSTKTVLKLRDMALFVTGIETTMRMDSLNSMRLENFKELEPGVYAWRVRVKRSPKKNSHSQDRLSTDNAEWRDWYVSPHAIAVIGEYLEATKRNWQSQGPVWLTIRGQPLLLKSQMDIITEWLKIAGCQFTRPHILRHTGIDRLVNKFNQPIPTVQAISQHSDPVILINVYAKRATVDAFRTVNQIFPSRTMAESNYQELLTAIGVKLNELSAKISRRKQDKRVFTHQHAEELLASLQEEIARLSNFLGAGSSTDVVVFSKENYQRLGDALQAADLSFEQVLGQELKGSSQTIIKRTGRKPKPLFNT